MSGGLIVVGADKESPDKTGWLTDEAEIVLADIEGPEALEAVRDLARRHRNDAFRVCIHRGTQQIGGTCIELSCGGERILLDLGLPLDAGDTEPETLLPPIAGLREPDPSLLAVVISHGHADHWGLAPFAAPGLRIVTGAATRRIMAAAAAFIPRAVEFAEGGEGSLDRTTSGSKSNELQLRSGDGAPSTHRRQSFRARTSSP